MRVAPFTNHIFFLRYFQNFIWKKIYLWSDGCASQYKGKTSFWYLKNFKDINIERNFFGSEHGKNESDAVTGQISRTVHDAIKSRRHVINNAEDMLTFLSAKMNESKSETNEAKYVFKLITDTDMKPINLAFENVKLSVLTGN